MYAHVQKVYKDICATLRRQRQNKCEHDVVLKVYCRIHTLEVAGLYPSVQYCVTKQCPAGNSDWFYWAFSSC